MGGKGGDGGGGVSQSQMDAGRQSIIDLKAKADSGDADAKAYWDATYGPQGNYRATYVQLFGEDPAPAAAVQQQSVEQPVQEQPVQEQPKTDEPVVTTPDPTGPKTGTGSGIDQPTSSGNPAVSGTGGVGDALGGTIIRPPNYWVGGAYNPAMPTYGRGTGRVKTTQT